MISSISCEASGENAFPSAMIAQHAQQAVGGDEVVEAGVEGGLVLDPAQHRHPLDAELG